MITKSWVGLSFALCTGVVAFFSSSTVVGAYTWYTYNGHEYSLTENWETWTSAENEAIGVGGHLVAISSAEENSWLTSQFGYTYRKEIIDGPGWDALAFIGLTRDPNGEWKWTTGEVLDYTNWWRLHYQYSGTHAFMHVEGHYEPGYWNNAEYFVEDGIPSSNYLRGIIERETSPVPEPATVLLVGAGLAGLAGWRKKFRKK